MPPKKRENPDTQWICPECGDEWYMNLDAGVWERDKGRMR